MADDPVFGGEGHDNRAGPGVPGVGGERAGGEVVDAGDVFEDGDGRGVKCLGRGGAGAGEGEAVAAHDVLDHGWGGVFDAHDSVDDVSGERIIWTQAGERLDRVFSIGFCGIDIEKRAGGVMYGSGYSIFSFLRLVSTEIGREIRRG